MKNSTIVSNEQKEVVVEPITLKKTQLLAAGSKREFINVLQTISLENLENLRYDTVFCDQLSREYERELIYMHDIRKAECGKKTQKELEEKCKEGAALTGAICGLVAGGLAGGGIAWWNSLKWAKGLLTVGGCAAGGGAAGYHYAHQNAEKVWAEHRRNSQQQNPQGAVVPAEPGLS